jgi:hypothetical protein
MVELAHEAYRSVVGTCNQAVVVFGVHLKHWRALGVETVCIGGPYSQEKGCGKRKEGLEKHYEKCGGFVV